MMYARTLTSLALAASLAALQTAGCSGEDTGSTPAATAGTPEADPPPAPNGGMAGNAPAGGGAAGGSTAPEPTDGGGSNSGGTGGTPGMASGGSMNTPEGGSSTGGEDAAGGEMAMGGQGGMGGEMGMGGAAGEPGLTLEGAPPGTQKFDSRNGFDLLPATPMFSHFQVENDRVQLKPLENSNWPPDFDWRRAPGRDPELNEKHLWARAELKETLKEWYYDVTLDHCGESDGESPFAISVNGEIVEEFSAAPSGDTSCERQTHVFKRVPIPAGAKVQILGKSNSNLTVGEAANGRMFPPCPNGEQCKCPQNFNTCTWAWARARWYSAEFAPTPGVQ